MRLSAIRDRFGALAAATGLATLVGIVPLGCDSDEPASSGDGDGTSGDGDDSLEGLNRGEKPNPELPVVTARIETEPVKGFGDAADDPAIWIHPTDPEKSLILGTDKTATGGLFVYDMQGREVDFLELGELNNVDLRSGFQLGDREVTLVTATNRTGDTLEILALDHETLEITDVAQGDIETVFDSYGLCMYKSPEGKFYSFVNSALGNVLQFELVADGDEVTANLVREFCVETQPEDAMRISRRVPKSPRSSAPSSAVVAPSVTTRAANSPRVTVTTRAPSPSSTRKIVWRDVRSGSRRPTRARSRTVGKSGSVSTSTTPSERRKGYAMKMLRRGFLQGVVGASSSPLLGSAAIVGSTTLGCNSSEVASRTSIGNLTADPEGILDLAEGFEYFVLETKGDMMSDGHAVGGEPDGMACFEDGEESYVLMRNHEEEEGASPIPEVAYNPNMIGGVSRLVLDKQTLERKSSNWVLVGTSSNCAGGPSPWGWLSCEESDVPGHGYVFLCSTTAEQAEEPQRAPSLGCFKHEAVAVDPDSHVIYLTEDTRKSAFYRHVPTDSPFVGRLEAMKVVGEDELVLSLGASVGDTWEVEWVSIEDPSGESLPTASQAFQKGAALVNRGEGCWYSKGAIFFVSTEGGPAARGQVFRLDPDGDGGILTLIAQVEEDDSSMINPDNITVSPSGEIYIVEDNNGPNHIRRVNPDGSVDTFARNAIDGGVSEICGVCFSPDGRVMFVNIQTPGITVAIRGPFATQESVARG